MSFPGFVRNPTAALATLDRLLERRWVQAAIFLSALVLFWLLDARVAHAG